MSPPKRSRGQASTSSSSSGIVPSRPIEALLAASLTTAVMLPQPGRNPRPPSSSAKSLPASKSIASHGSSSSLARTTTPAPENVPTTSASMSGTTAAAAAEAPAQPSSSRKTPTPPIRTRSPSPHHQYNTSFLSSEKATSPKKPPKAPSSYASVGTMTATQPADDPVEPLAELVDADETWCLSCPPNSLGFSTALAFKESKPVTAKPRKLGRKADGARDYIGFATLPEQVHRKSVKRGFDFTLLVVGESGLGKSTLINSLFLGDLYRDRRIPDVADRVEKTTTIEKKSMDIEERGVKLRLTIVDTPGFGDGVNCEESWRACVSYVDDQFRQYFTDENGLNRRNLQDNRVHCCLYFVPPYGHGLRQIDVEFMRRLHRKVNIVPVIAKADTLTAGEVVKLKRQVLADIEENKIQIYQFPDCDSDEDEDFKLQDRELKACIPFAVVGSNTVLEVGGRKVRGRQYPWGVVEVENPKHSDFSKLRNMLITTHMQDLKDVTEDVHYENFRAQCISQISQQAIRERGSVKLKRDSGPPLDASITETDRLLLQKDEEIRRMQDMLSQMQEKLKQSGNKRDSVVNV